jgi:hypothetical protein
MCSTSVTKIWLSPTYNCHPVHTMRAWVVELVPSLPSSPTANVMVLALRYWLSCRLCKHQVDLPEIDHGSISTNRYALSCCPSLREPLPCVYNHRLRSRPRKVNRSILWHSPVVQEDISSSDILQTRADGPCQICILYQSQHQTAKKTCKVLTKPPTWR